MENIEGLVIAFYCDNILHPYCSLTWKDRALRVIKGHIPGKVVASAANAFLKGKAEFDLLLRRISLEAGIVNQDQMVLDFIRRKVTEDEPIFLDMTEEHIAEHNAGLLAQSHFVIASVYVEPLTFTLMNPQLFSIEEQEAIFSIVKRSQTEKLRSSVV
ncbi:MAG: hypothetical protein WDZ75_01680 [Candidatus Paceibacterota bacterium]